MSDDEAIASITSEVADDRQGSEKNGSSDGCSESENLNGYSANEEIMVCDVLHMMMRMM